MKKITLSIVALAFVACGRNSSLKVGARQNNLPTYDAGQPTTAPIVTTPTPTPNSTPIPTNPPGTNPPPPTVPPTPIPPLTAVSAEEGEAPGQVLLHLSYPPNVGGWFRIGVRRILGQVPPHFDCASDGQEVINFLGPFTLPTLIDNTPYTNGRKVSYRFCIYGTAGQLNSANSLVGVNTHDGVAPPALTTFSATRGATGGQVQLTLAFPADASDYDSVSIRRAAGTAPPGCNGGTEVQRLTVFAPLTISDNTGAPGQYSYRACIYDDNHNLTATNTATVNASACAPGSGGVEIGNYCFYMSDESQSCDAACNGHGGCNLVGTRDYIGSGGSEANCSQVANAVLDANGRNGSIEKYWHRAPTPWNLGCWTNIAYMAFQDAGPGSSQTTCGGSFTTFHRFCACNN